MHVKQGEWNKVNYPDEIFTYGIGPCVALGIYDETNKTAYLIHHDDGEITNSLEEFIQKAIHESSNKNNLKIWVTGAGIFHEDGDEIKISIESTKQYVEEILKKEFTESQYKIKWNPKDNEAEMIIVTKLGDCQIIHKKNDDSSLEENFI